MIYKLGKFHIDTGRSLILLGENASVVNESHRIVAALSLLITRYPALVTKDELISHVWVDTDIGESSLSRLIADIRQVFAAYDKDTFYIKTVHRKGFQLLVEPESPKHLEDQEKQVLPLETSIEPIRKKRARLVIAICAVVLVCVAMWSWLDSSGEKTVSVEKDDDVKYPDLSLPEEKLIPGHIEQIPLSHNWWASGGVQVEYGEGSVGLDVLGTEQILAYIYRGPQNLFGAKVSFQVDVSKSYIEAGADLQVFAQSERGSWPGEWNCFTPNSELRLETFDVSCQLKEPAAIFSVQKEEQIRIGVRALGKVSGRVAVRKGELHILPTVPLDRGWYSNVSRNAVNYANGGVHYQPKKTGDRLYIYLTGPLELENKIMHFTLAADQDYIDSGALLQVFAQTFTNDWSGVWNCWINSVDLSPKGDTYSCKIESFDKSFNLAKGEKLHLGVHAEGKKLAGKVSILGVNFE